MRLSGHDALRLDVAGRVWEKFWEKSQQFFRACDEGNIALYVAPPMELRHVKKSTIARGPISTSTLKIVVARSDSK
jgi:hypothetical protein